MQIFGNNQFQRRCPLILSYQFLEVERNSEEEYSDRNFEGHCKNNVGRIAGIFKESGYFPVPRYRETVQRIFVSICFFGNNTSGYTQTISSSWQALNFFFARSTQHGDYSVGENSKLKMQENWEPQGEYEDLLATNLLGEKETGSRVLTSALFQK